MDQISIQDAQSPPDQGMNSVQDGTSTLSSEEVLKKHLEKQEQIRKMATKVVPVRSRVPNQALNKEPRPRAYSRARINQLAIPKSQMTSSTPRQSPPTLVSAKSPQIKSNYAKHPHEAGDIPQKGARGIEDKEDIQALEHKMSLLSFSIKLLRDELKKCEDKSNSLGGDLKLKDIELTSLRRQLESSTEVKHKMIVDNMQFISNLESKSKKATSCMTILQARVATLEDQLKAASEAAKYQDWAFQSLEGDLKEEQNKVQDLEKEVEDSKTRAIKIATDLATQLRAIQDLQEENRIIKEMNQSLVSKESVEREKVHTLEGIIVTLKEKVKGENEAKKNALEALGEVLKRFWDLEIRLQNAQRANIVKNVKIPQEPKVEPIGEGQEKPKSKGTQTLEILGIGDLEPDSVANFRSQVQDKTPKKSWAQPLRKFFGLKNDGRILPWKKSDKAKC